MFAYFGKGLCAFCLLHSGFLFGLLLHPEDEGNIFPQNLAFSELHGLPTQGERDFYFHCILYKENIPNNIQGLFGK
jgi:hypothetical protein